MEIKKSQVITIDGPSGSGKGTISLLVAQKLGWDFLDSGALYRLVGFAANSHSIPFGDEAALKTLAAHLDVQFVHANDQVQIILEGEAVQDSIRTEEVGNWASKVAAFQGVRDALLERQRAFQQPPGLVADGRDMGTVVFPDAEAKFFLTASAEERAQRRYKQLKLKGLDVNLASLAKEIAERDERDFNRAIAPLRPADDAQYVDSTGLGIEAVLEQVLAAIQKRIGLPR